ncbi:hypothetical protein PP7435_CHR1-0205 [Komagataella phaffii CBS 7435]|uniref:Impact N-terminal domain-containing protein n=2 Tax=Komagataella phaffii TaxID=460519 RepID=C4QVJ3_KOMPG|nr:uncharacterized protein PAS_chr1-3_0305 [Komagataella phaffii GS115]AOA61689.1 GQ67_02461T0 [Komagataella phaffii]CAH2445922.1 hypothetical protein BQ9382_C1-1085 [Komagataella phaffii CBS 7435]AOA65561.1 GQ68_02786T0 [Komagataella phaffii GS115]CAY67266.1 hypothetical protein PAS_chr1-3_0305 [Komagataella phaffii GS115]CCA36369.1 hypothetical protein PP7435_CHR1-0205 [Komagataella phaffii CBS 7435]
MSRLGRVWNATAPLLERKSKFIGWSTPLTEISQLEPVLQEFTECHQKVLSKATHPKMYAWRLTDDAGKLLNQGSHDDGESGAGNRLLGLLELYKCRNVLVVVSRWYGGIPLGPSRFRCISSAAQESLKIGGFITTKTKLNRK